ncbi:hypothetical protein [Mangrovicoccus ximenensis]|uniref:hypothetical protein n=1 Tax=Mangrovicoccus ximenensis TaxID=1911570 RepID=UPI000D33F00A|nr:hypothetical protein [Mangrovicoccus ximenensis]
MNTKFAALALIAAAATAGAANASDQLASRFGLEPGAYTTAELAQLSIAVDRNDTQRIAYILERKGDTTAEPSAQLAAGLNVEPGRYNGPELVALKHAIDRDEPARIAFLAEQGLQVTRDANAGSANAQLARAVGVEPGSTDNASLAAAYLAQSGAGDD